MNTSVFNPAAFMQQSTTDSNDTKVPLVPEGEYAALIKSVEPRVVGKDSRPTLNVRWTVSDDAVRAETGLAEPSVFQTIWLDLKEDGSLDGGKGKNVGLGKLREALGQNVPGQPWNPGMLANQMAKIKVTHSIYQNEPQANVSGVTKL